MINIAEAARIELNHDLDGMLGDVFRCMFAEDQRPHAQGWIDCLDVVRPSYSTITVD
jgi:hypothetical protein